MTLTIDFAGLTDIGRVRKENEDQWFADPLQGLYLVADGMGGALGGDLASKAVVKALPMILREKLRDLREDESAAVVCNAIVDGLVALSEHLRSESRGQEGLDGMGSTVVLLLVRGSTALIGHLGDSRAYLMRDGCLEQLTKDHTIVQLLLDSSDLKPDEVADHPARGQLTRFVGMENNALPDVNPVDLIPGDRFLLCSDGLTGMLRDDDVIEVLRSNAPPEEMCRKLVDSANQAGGRDNITALLLHFHSAPVSD